MMAACAAAQLSNGSAAVAATGNRLAHAAGGPMLRAPSVAQRSLEQTSQAGIAQAFAFNWSGYAQSAEGATFYAVTDTWTVPTVDTSLPGIQFSSDWVGIGGFSDQTLVQAGTQADNIDGLAYYNAWTEILPASERPLALPIHPGDTVTTTVQQNFPGIWRMTVQDDTSKAKAVRIAFYGGSSHASVEAIHERPSVLGGLATLAKTSNVTFDPGEYSTAYKGAPSYTPLLNPAPGASVNQVFMVNSAGTEVIAAPSLPDADNDGFGVAFGSASPSPPAS
jgi:hypothetical protein